MTRRRYFEAKARLFSDRFASVGAVNADDERGREIGQRAIAAGLDVIEYSLSREGAAVHARDVQLVDDGARFTLVDTRVDGQADVRIGLVGRHNVANALAAAATARAIDMPFDAVVTGLGAVTHVPGRLEAVDAGQDFGVYVDYAHTPDALAHAHRRGADGRGRRVVSSWSSAAAVTATARSGRRWARSRRRRPTSRSSPRTTRGRSRPRRSPRQMLEGVAPGTDVTVELDRRVAIRSAVAAAASGDVVLIAGKGHETGQTAGGVTVPFDDRVVAREEIEAACS